MSELISNNQFSPANIFCRPLSITDQTELKNLHNEWFPINYTQEFYDRIKKKTVIAIGCFYKLSESTAGCREIIIGTIMSKIQNEGENN